MCVHIWHKLLGDDFSIVLHQSKKQPERQSKKYISVKMGKTFIPDYYLMFFKEIINEQLSKAHII